LAFFRQFRALSRQLDRLFIRGSAGTCSLIVRQGRLQWIGTIVDKKAATRRALEANLPLPGDMDSKENRPVGILKFRAALPYCFPEIDAT
jgi:hypothetical protein